ncbi:NLPA lipoprotein [Listeria weihenstephanensis FSL R9-0317]|uniref:Lipoprotein n=1 Tax=Listeria weihenstephanensis TaxID=1006155 RepID=A0A1S7FTF8_9LIST|nr:MetQ/NlpA family ABC transporter substrate-binding protein [Listeria weihenstephanensis]AQY50672.1 methionine ABC transporter substrate-binding protein [Listeria weihenstephanensis]EUJ36244.1 NLPA lipoprotein [Listeria weihenstephanensis FSL R9-0317]
MKKIILALTLVLLAVVAVGCGGTDDKANGDEKSVVIGVSAGDRTWPEIKKIAKKDGINIELKEFSDYVLPNRALEDGDLDANAFQTIAYFDSFIKENKLDLEPLASTVIAPMGVYSNKVKDIKDIKKGATIAVPDDSTNYGRALLLLQEAGLITLVDDFDGNGSPEAVKENPKNLTIKPMVAGQIPRALDDVDAAAINNGVAVEAKLDPLNDAIFLESDTAKPYINIIAVRKGDTDRAALKKIVEIYHSDEMKKFIDNTYKGSSIPAFVPLSELETYKETWSKK